MKLTDFQRVIRDLGYDPRHIDEVTFGVKGVTVRRAIWDTEKDSPVVAKETHPVTGEPNGTFVETTDFLEYES